jgi:hypothetical protein
MPKYTLWAVDDLGLQHSCHAAEYTSRASALGGCKKFFPKEDSVFGGYHSHSVTNSIENRRAYIKAWTCRRCKKSPLKAPDGNFFLIDNGTWKSVVPKSYQKKIICRECYDGFVGTK